MLTTKQLIGRGVMTVIVLACAVGASGAGMYPLSRYSGGGQGWGRPSDLAAPAGKVVSVSIQNGGYSPASVSIHVGDTITWTNADDQDHTVIAQDGSFNSGNIGSGRSFSHTFTTAGTIAYYCKYHPRMKGAVVVAAK